MQNDENMYKLRAILEQLSERFRDRSKMLARLEIP